MLAVVALIIVVHTKAHAYPIHRLDSISYHVHITLGLFASAFESNLDYS